MREIINEFKKINGDMSDAAIADRLGWSKGKLSQIINGKYPEGPTEDAKKEARRILLGENEPLIIQPAEYFAKIKIKPNVIVNTEDLMSTYSLCNGLLDPASSLTASIGLITGVAGRGKTTAVRRFCSETEGVCYILYMGFSRSALFKRIAEELVGRSNGTYYSNLNLIMEATRVYRKLIIIDEADRMPLSLLEDLRTLNESGLVPILLVGEPSLAALTRKADRIESRIRKPRIEFHSLDYLTLATFYSESCGLKLSKSVAERLVKRANGDFRVAANEMQNIVRLMNINSQSELTTEVFDGFEQR